ncbi:MAG: hypothetical protein R3181_15250, partial [Rubricoccaceae bacterium]|nr:hypothetical protein [Rubricoccaceae bacterium]
ASGYRARNQLGGEFAAFVPATSAAPEHLLLVRNRYDWTNWAGQARLDGLLNARASYEVQATASHHASGYGYGGGVGEAEAPGSMEALEEAAAAVRPSVPLDGGTDWRHTIQELALTGALSYSLSPRTQVEGGLGVGYTDARIDRTGRFLAPLAHGADDWTLVAHATGQITVGAGTVVEPCVRLTYLPSFDRAYPEPRLALRHDGGSALGPYALRVATGLYRQYTNEYLLSSTGATSVVPYVLFWLPPDGSIAPPYAYHAALDAALWPTEAWTVEASAYAKAQPRLLALDHTPIVATGDAALRETREDQAQEDLLSAVRGHTLGGTVRARWRHRGVSASTAYTHTHARRQVPGRFEGRLLPLPGTAPHALDLDAGLGLGRGVRVGASWRGSWGRRWALRRSYYDVLALAEGAGALPPFDLDAPEEHALPATMALDLDLTLTRPLGRSTLVLRALLANATDHRNVYDWSLETAASGAVAQPRLLPGRHLAFSVRVQL